MLPAAWMPPERVGLSFLRPLACPGAVSGCAGCVGCAGSPIGSRPGYVGEGEGDKWSQGKPTKAGPTKTQIMTLRMQAEQLVEQVGAIVSNLDPSTDAATRAEVEGLFGQCKALLGACLALEQQGTGSYTGLQAQRAALTGQVNGLLARVEPAEEEQAPPPPPKAAPKPAPAPKPAQAPPPAPAPPAAASSLESPGFGALLRKVPTVVWAGVGAVVAVAGAAALGRR